MSCWNWNISMDKGRELIRRWISFRGNTKNCVDKNGYFRVWLINTWPCLKRIYLLGCDAFQSCRSYRRFGWTYCEIPARHLLFAAYLLGLLIYPEYGNSGLPRNVVELLPDYMASHPRSYSKPSLIRSNWGGEVIHISEAKYSLKRQT
jgi:hypothetical protein